MRHNHAEPFFYIPEPSEINAFIKTLSAKYALLIEAEFCAEYPEATFDSMFSACLGDVIDDNAREFIRDCVSERRS
jgi:hypothetical protein